MKVGFYVKSAKTSQLRKEVISWEKGKRGRNMVESVKS